MILQAHSETYHYGQTWSDAQMPGSILVERKPGEGFYLTGLPAVTVAVSVYAAYGISELEFLLID